MRKRRAKVRESKIVLDSEDCVALDEAVAATRNGTLIPFETVRGLLRKL